MKVEKKNKFSVKILFYLFCQKNAYEVFKGFVFLKLKKFFKDWIEHINKYHSLPVDLRVLFLKQQIQEHVLAQKKKTEYLNKFLKTYLETEEISPETQPDFFAFPEETFTKYPHFILIRSLDTLKMSLASSPGLFTEYFQKLEKTQHSLPLSSFHFEELSYH